jgi:hypothetical protein
MGGPFPEISIVGWPRLWLESQQAYFKEGDPQGLKPAAVFCAFFGTTKVVPFHDGVKRATTDAAECYKVMCPATHRTMQLKLRQHKLRQHKLRQHKFR